MKKTDILHIITDLGFGGAEMMLFKLLRTMRKDTFRNRVVSLKETGPIGKRIASLSIPVHGMGMKAGWPLAPGMVRLSRLISRLKPAIVQTWLYHADMLGSLACIASTARPKIVWNIRHSDFDPRKDKLHTRLTMQLCAWLSHGVPDRIICNSQRAAAIHQRSGYAFSNFKIIANGFDMNEFRRDTAAYGALRQDLGLHAQATLVGMVGRFHSQKNHAGFIRVARMIENSKPGVHFVLCGKGVDASNGPLREWIEKEHLTSQFHLLGERPDMNRITPAFDLAVSCSSVGEGFSNAIGEAMACEVPCVATDVGDSTHIIGNTGIVLPPNRTDLFAQACLGILSLKPSAYRSLGKKARAKIQRSYSIESITKQYERLYLSMLK